MPAGGFYCNQKSTMKLKLLPTIIAVAACLCCPLANAKPTLTPYQIVHKDSGMCIDMLARLENCDHDSPMQKFYFLNVGSLEDVIPQTATNPAGTSSRIVIILSAGFDRQTEQIGQLLIDDYWSPEKVSSTPSYVKSLSQLSQDVRSTWYLDRVEPKTQYSNAFFRIRDAYRNGVWQPQDCVAYVDRGIVARAASRCPASASVFRLQPTTYPAAP
jgi:hypothetical protein